MYYWWMHKMWKQDSITIEPDSILKTFLAAMIFYNKPLSVCQYSIHFGLGYEALESVMCDVIKINFKRRDDKRSGKGNT